MATACADGRAQRTLKVSTDGRSAAPTKVLRREPLFADSFAAVDWCFIENRHHSMFISSLPPHLTEVTLSCGVPLLIVGVLAAHPSPGEALPSLPVLAAA
jgi:hypothetical protein